MLPLPGNGFSNIRSGGVGDEERGAFIKQPIGNVSEISAVRFGLVL